MSWRVAGAACAIAAALATAAPAAARFSHSGTASGSFSAATVAPAGTPTITWRCTGNGKNPSRQAIVTWAASASSFVTGYAVERQSPPSTSWAQVGTTDAATLTIAFGGFRPNTTVSFRVLALAHQWISQPTPAATSTAPATCP